MRAETLSAVEMVREDLKNGAPPWSSYFQVHVDSPCQLCDRAIVLWACSWRQQVYSSIGEMPLPVRGPFEASAVALVESSLIPEAVRAAFAVGPPFVSFAVKQVPSASKQ